MPLLETRTSKQLCVKKMHLFCFMQKPRHKDIDAHFLTNRYHIVYDESLYMKIAFVNFSKF